MKERWIFIMILGMWPGLGEKAIGQSFPQFLTRIHAVPPDQRQVVADSFLLTIPAFPYPENDTTVHFIFKGDAQSVGLAGDATGWLPSLDFTNIAGCDFWYLSLNYESDARLDYKLVINQSSWITDPKNPNTCKSGFGTNSAFRMPQSKAPPETTFDLRIPPGTIIDTLCFSASLNNTRKVAIYLPNGYSVLQEEYPVILFNDGLEYLELCQVNHILNYLIHKRIIAPVIAIFVAPVDRDPEYSGNRKDLYSQFITEELMTALDSKFRISRNPQKRAIIGISNGGNIALYIGVNHPEKFGKIAAQSSNVIQEITNVLRSKPPLPLSFYLDIGTYDIDVLIPMATNLKTLLHEKGYPLEFREWHEGHSWCNWKEHLRYPLAFFFPYSSVKENYDKQDKNHQYFQP